jgi:hypothetical protein
MRQFLKFLHELGAIGMLGALAAHLVLLVNAAGLPPAEYAAVRLGIVAISKWILVPSLGLVLVSGLLAMSAHPPFFSAGWALLKLVLGVAMFEGTLITVQASARRAAEFAVQAAAGGEIDAARMAEAVRSEWIGLWVIGSLLVLNVVLAVWRPRLSRRNSERRPTDAPASEGVDSAPSHAPRPTS